MHFEKSIYQSTKRNILQDFKSLKAMEVRSKYFSFGKSHNNAALAYFRGAEQYSVKVHQLIKNLLALHRTQTFITVYGRDHLWPLTSAT
jgi:hypothetical protein